MHIPDLILHFFFFASFECTAVEQSLVATDGALGPGCRTKATGVILCPSNLPRGGCFAAPDISEKYISTRYLPLGKGGFGRVDEGADRETLLPVAVKTVFVQGSDPHLVNDLILEADIAMLFSSRDTNLAHSLAAVVYRNALCLVMDKYDESLLSFLNSLPSFHWHGRWMREEDAQVVMLQFLRGLGIMHSGEVVISHRDVKSDNVFLSRDRGEVVLGDFGVSTVHSKDVGNLVYEGGGTRKFVPPRLREARGFFKKEGVTMPVLEMDIYAVGMVLFEMLHGPNRKLSFVPQSQAPAVSIDSWALEQRVPVLDRFRLSSKAADLLTQLLTGHPEVIRGGVSAVLEHPWFSTPASELALEIQRNLHDDQLFELSLLGEWRWRKRAAFAHLRKQLQKAAAPLLVPATSSRYSMRGWHAFLPSSEVDFSSASAVEMERKRR